MLLPGESIQNAVTSLPYWSMRDYNVDEQIGRDDKLADYVANIVKTFGKLKHVLREGGTVWLNVGDSYTSGNRRYRAPDNPGVVRTVPSWKHPESQSEYQAALGSPELN